MTPASLIPDLIAFSVQLTVVAISLALLLKIVHVPARARYVCLRLALGVCLVLPWVLRTPERPAPASQVVQAGIVTRQPTDVFPDGAIPREADDGAPRGGARGEDIDWADVVLGVLLFGAAGRVLWLVVGFTRLRRLKDRGQAIDDAEYAALQQQIGTRATIAEIAGLAQPATFGLRAPIVLLPRALADRPVAIRRAVVAHELFHVRRRDWLSVVGEEALRTLFWFHPAILWLTASIQLAREQIVDELTVRTTGDRRGYIQALLAFSDSARVLPAAAFAQRRHLFSRIVNVSQEHAMSVSRLVASGVVLVAGVLAAGWYASSAFPIVMTVRAEPAPVLPTADDLLPMRQAPERSALAEPGGHPAVPIIGAESRQQNVSAAGQRAPRRVTPENPIPRRTHAVSPIWPSAFGGELVQVAVEALVTVDGDGAVTNVERRACGVSAPRTPSASLNLPGICGAFFDAATAAIRQWQYERPLMDAVQFYVIVSFRPGSEPAITQSGTPLRVTSAGPTLMPEITVPVRTPIEQSLRAREMELRAVLRELTRIQAQMTPGGPDTVRLQQEIASLMEQVSRVERALRDAGLASGTAPAPPEATPAAPPQGRLLAPSGRIPLRVGGAIPGPRALVTPKATYSSEAMEARVEGTVAVDALVDEEGRVADVRLIRSIPLLDASAMASARQWRFTPTLLNGEPVPVIVRLEISFTLRD